MKKKLRKRLNEIYKVFCENDNRGKFEQKLNHKYEDEIISGMWDFFLLNYKPK